MCLLFFSVFSFKKKNVNYPWINKQAHNPFLFELLIFSSLVQWDLFLFLLRGLIEHELMRTSEILSCLHSLEELPWPSVSN